MTINSLKKTSDLKVISIRDIDIEDREFLITFPLRSDGLINSIKEIGVVSPIILRDMQDRYQIISGFKRVFACRESDIESIKAIVYSKNELTDKEAFYFNLYENLTLRPFNIVEKAMILNKLFKRIKINKKEYKKKFLPLLGIDLNKKQLKDFFCLLDLDKKIKTYFVEKNISLKNILQWVRFTKKEQQDLFRFISPLRLNSNKLREVLLFLEEICQRDKISVKDIIDCIEIQDVLNNKNITASQKSSKIRDILKRKRFPQLTSMEKSFANTIKDLKLPKGIIFRPPEYFEEKEFSIEFKIKNKEELKRISGELLNVSEKEKISKLFKMSWKNVRF